MELDRFRRLPLVGNRRGIASADVHPLTEAVIDAGLTCIEITLNTPATLALIARMRAPEETRLMVGAGTVLDLDALGVTRAAGASFNVMPTRSSGGESGREAGQRRVRYNCHLARQYGLPAPTFGN